MPSPRHSVSVAGAIIDDQDRFLAIRRQDNGHWEPPGGVLELDETIEEGLVREIREETGLTAIPERLTGVYKNMRQGIVALVFRCSIGDTGHATTGDEAAEIRWLTTEEVKQHMDQAYAVRLLDAFVSAPPAVRSHNGVTVQETASP